MKRVLILVEGQTEETAVRDIIQPCLLEKDICIIPTILTTKRVKDGKDFKGGVSRYEKIRKELKLLLADTDAQAITTFLDYYGLPGDFPGKKDLRSSDCFERVTFLERAFSEDIEDKRFLPFLALHEFEAYLFCSPGEMAKAFPDQTLKDQFNNICNQFDSPEEINQGKDTHPSARITGLVAGYEKAHHGPLIVGRIGLDNIREQCRHFNEWICKLESI